jgi:hypothetical protein
MLFWLALAAATASLLWYMLAMPGASSTGALEALVADQRVLVENLRRHVSTVASREHNLYDNPAELDVAARHIEFTLAGLGYAAAAFRREGYPALMVTDTALYRYPHYHTMQDTPDKVDYERLARVVTGLHGMLRELAQGP